MIYYKLDTETGKCVYSGTNFTDASSANRLLSLFENNSVITSFEPHDDNIVTELGHVSQNVFHNCPNLVKIDLRGIAGGLVEECNQFATDCPNLEYVYFNNDFWSACTSLYFAFGCTVSTGNKIHGDFIIDAPLCENWSDTFRYCGKSKPTGSKLNITIVSIADNIIINRMFSYSKVNTISFASEFQTIATSPISAQPTDVFRDCDELTTIYAVSDMEDIAEYSSQMFYGCTNLIGGNGTAYDPQNVTGVYAVIDRDGRPGYFTAGRGYDPYNPDKPGELTSDYPDYGLGTGYMQYGDTNMVTIFTPTEAQLQYLQEKFYGENFIDYIFTSAAYAALGATDCLLSLSVFPFNITKAGTKYLRSKWWTTGIPLDYTNVNYVEFDCGSLTVDRLYNNFLDFKSQVQIYLPFVSYQSLDVEDVMGKTINVKYRVDLISGDCVVLILIDGYLKYQFQGNVAYQLPITTSGGSNILQKGATAALTIAAGKSAMGAGAMMMNDAERLGAKAEDSDPYPARLAREGEMRVAEGRRQINEGFGNISNMFFGQSSRSGAMGGNTGLLSGYKPYLIIKRPRLAPTVKDYGRYYGYPCNQTFRLGDLNGYTQVSKVYIENINATTVETTKIEQLLKKGVIL